MRTDNLSRQRTILDVQQPYCAIQQFVTLTSTLKFTPFLGAFTKFRKATISFVVSAIRPYVRMEQLGSYCTDFREI